MQIKHTIFLSSAQRNARRISPTGGGAVNYPSAYILVQFSDTAPDHRSVSNRRMPPGCYRSNRPARSADTYYRQPHSLRQRYNGNKISLPRKALILKKFSDYGLFSLLKLFPLALGFFPTVTFRLILGKFLGDFARFASFFSVFSVFSARLVLFWYQSLVSIFRKIGGEKIDYSFAVIDTRLIPRF